MTVVPAALGLCAFLLVVTFAEIAEGAEAAEPGEAEEQPWKPSWERDPREEEPEYDDYRLTLVGIDAAAVSMSVTGAVLSEVLSENASSWQWLILGGLGTYAFGGPIVHLANDQPKRSLWSLGLRVGVPSAGILVALTFASSCSSESDGCYGAVIFGGVVTVGGVIAAIIIDDGFLGRVPINKQNDAAVRTRSFQVGMTPIFDPKKGTFGLSLVGAY